ncbi:glycosyltransferase [Burkholderia multivorans]|uniref:glycosyltransferase n=1 Tax=Burkholderia ubonensis TaxID=101571 RepID=UPI000F6D8FFE|nr:glycosyltransferase [Burkholderia ubonensis]AYZ67545.1 glycosyltransferase [Burkholderia multivorans]VWB64495.1 glycosyltransferase [Burkholderia ubonensis]
MKDSNKPRISVLLVTYNHEEYVADALKSIINQNYDGFIQIVVADDASTDGTLAVIKGYEGIDSRFSFKYLDSTKNRGITRNYQRAFAECETEYVAVLEGDDLWTHRKKLTKQIGIMDDCSECVMCASNYFIWDEGGARFTSRTSVDSLGFMYIDSRYIIGDNLPGNFSACMYRTSALRRIDQRLFDLKAYDWAVNICIGMQGLIAYAHEPLSIYRVHGGGAWSGLSSADKIQEQLDAVDAYDKFTNGIFAHEFGTLRRNLKQRQLLEKGSSAVGVKAGLRGVKRAVKMLTPPVMIHLARLVLPPAFFVMLTRL